MSELSLLEKLSELEQCKHLLTNKEYKATKRAILDQFCGGRLKITSYNILLCMYIIYLLDMFFFPFAYLQSHELYNKS
jgi:hypothetical protein